MIKEDSAWGQAIINGSPLIGQNIFDLSERVQGIDSRLTFENISKISVDKLLSSVPDLIKEGPEAFLIGACTDIFSTLILGGGSAPDPLLTIEDMITNMQEALKKQSDQLGLIQIILSKVISNQNYNQFNNSYAVIKSAIDNINTSKTLAITTIKEINSTVGQEGDIANTPGFSQLDSICKDLYTDINTIYQTICNEDGTLSSYLHDLEQLLTMNNAMPNNTSLTFFSNSNFYLPIHNHYTFLYSYQVYGLQMLCTVKMWQAYFTKDKSYIDSAKTFFNEFAFSAPQKDANGGAAPTKFPQQLTRFRNHFNKYCYAPFTNSDYLPEHFVVNLLPVVDKQDADFYFNISSGLIVYGKISYCLRDWSPDNVIINQFSNTVSKNWIMPEIFKRTLRYPSSQELAKMLLPVTSDTAVNNVYHGETSQYLQYLVDQGLTEDMSKNLINVAGGNSNNFIWLSDTRRMWTGGPYTWSENRNIDYSFAAPTLYDTTGNQCIFNEHSDETSSNLWDKFIGVYNGHTWGDLAAHTDATGQQIPMSTACQLSGLNGNDIPTTNILIRSSRSPDLVNQPGMWNPGSYFNENWDFNRVNGGLLVVNPTDLPYAPTAVSIQRSRTPFTPDISVVAEQRGTIVSRPGTKIIGGDGYTDQMGTVMRNGQWNTILYFFLTGSYPDNTGSWVVTAKNAGAIQPASIYAMYAQVYTVADPFDMLDVKIFKNTQKVKVGSTLNDCYIPDDYTLVGGGGTVEGGEAFLAESFPLKFRGPGKISKVYNGWRVLANVTDNADSKITAYAIGIKWRSNILNEKYPIKNTVKPNYYEDSYFIKNTNFIGFCRNTSLKDKRGFQLCGIGAAVHYNSTPCTDHIYLAGYSCVMGVKDNGAKAPLTAIDGYCNTPARPNELLNLDVYEIRVNIPTIK